MKKVRIRLKWKVLTPEQEQKIIADFDADVVRNKILRKYNIPEGQFVSIMRKTTEQPISKPAQTR